MQLWVDRTDRLSALLACCAFGLLLLVVTGSVEGAAATADSLEVVAASGGGTRATAQVTIPASPAIVQRLLTDYPHWPDLFEMRMHVATLSVLDGVATTDLRIEHPLIPGERRLVTESRVLPSGSLITDLKGGDFKRYHRVWKLESTGEGNQTRADFELEVEVESFVPDWLIVIAMRQELEAHFRILKQKALEHSKR
jgi:Polyketide cyclase / dehydrase and lipid transport